MRFKIYFLLVGLLFFSNVGFSVNYSVTKKLKWKDVQHVLLPNGQQWTRLDFSGAHFDKMEVVPFFSDMVPVHTANASIKAIFTNKEIIAASPEETLLLQRKKFADTSFFIDVYLSVVRKQPYAFLKIKPVRWNSSLKRYEKLINFTVDVLVDEYAVNKKYKNEEIPENSVLSKGQWFKIKIDRSGVFKISYNDLKNMGFPLDAPSDKIAIFGNGGGVLPENSNISRPAGLLQDAIEVIDGGDGKINDGDYILFYGRGPVTWKLDPAGKYFYHQTNYYSDYAYYFITVLDSKAKRIQNISYSNEDVDVNVNSFIDFAVHQLAERNLGGTGRTWYGEVFNNNGSYSFPFTFPDILKTKPAYFKCSLASNSKSFNKFLVDIDGELKKIISMPITGNSSYDVGKGASSNFSFAPVNNDKVNVKINFQGSDISSVGYLDYLELNVYRKLIMNGDQMIFTNIFLSDKKAMYHLTSDKPVRVWDISNVTQPLEMKLTGESQQQKYTFLSETGQVKKFVAFTGKSFFSPVFVEKVSNQNLHAVKNIDYLIIAYKDFIQEAERLAQWHREKDNMNVVVTTPAKIYNEFSSGAQDITAIRDFIKRIYDNSDPGKRIKYLLLFGDASYDYKNRIPDNQNFVPCWESVNSLNTINSIATDDYYGYLDTGEGNSYRDKVDIGIGRFPVDNIEEAKNAVDKSIRYVTPSKETVGTWRNIITFVADDGDYNRHLNDAEKLSKIVATRAPAIHINKIYLDAFPQISTPAGQRAPAMNKAIDSRIDEGTLIFNYSGHGGEVGLGHERFLQISDINSWTNYNKLAVFITATCEFTRYDDPKRVSAGELTFFSKTGGAIALFTTTRATYASSNLALNTAIYNNNLFEKTNGAYPCFGDVIMNSKVLGGDNDKKFILVGDPTLQLAYPKWNAITTKINSKITSIDDYDTIRALSRVNIQGNVENSLGQPEKTFNGTLYPTVYDKETSISTLGTDPDSRKITFKMWKNRLFQGKAPIVNGKFNFSFVVPKDIAYQYGRGRIDYYFTNDTIDGHGFNNKIIVGGFDEHAVPDTIGPTIRLYLNDSTFHSGNVTNTHPVLYALLSDESGINTSGTSIGHNITATLDNNTSQAINLNANYVASDGSFSRGIVTYPFQNLPAGKHSLKLRVWDLYNNSSTAKIEFVVEPAGKVIIQKLRNYPNPAIGSSRFIFDHNLAGEQLHVEISIFQMDGKLVKIIKKDIVPSGFNSGGIYWDGTGNSGEKLDRGVYIYKVKVTLPSGISRVLQSKMIFFP